MNIIYPSDISRIKFNTSLWGYNKQEVDEFIQQIQIDYTRIWKENIELKNTVEFLKKELESYRKMENIINESVVASKKLAEDIKMQAQNEAKYILSKASKEAEEIRIINQKKINELLNQINRLIEIRSEVISQTKNYLKSILDKIENTEKIFTNIESMYLQTNFISNSDLLAYKDKNIKEENI